MSKKFKSQASSARAASANIGGFGNSNTSFQSSSSLLSYVTELPDLTAITEPNVVVSVRNLSKKDHTTKAKALEDLQQFATAQQGEGKDIEDGFLEAWTSIFPRLSIENSRRVRQLAQSLQGTLTVLSGKRILPYLSKVVGPWLAGMQDTDKIVSRAAKQAYELAFNSEGKRENVWKIYGQEIFNHVRDATIIETVQTMSDERTTSPDDANSKHARVVATALLLLAELFEKVNSGHISINGSHEIKPSRPNVGQRDEEVREIDDLMATKKLWDYASHHDPFVRRSIYMLLQIYIAKAPQNLDWKLISNSFVAKALPINHLGSSVQYVETLIIITKACATIWTSDYSSKTSARKRLLHFLKNGSFRGTEQFWEKVEALLKLIPLNCWHAEVSPSDQTEYIALEDSCSLLEALHGGVCNVDEPRTNASAAWSTYMKISLWISQKLPTAEEHSMLRKRYLLPVLEQYVLATPNRSTWTLPGHAAPNICASSLIRLFELDQPLASEFWKRMSDTLTDKMRLSLPEQSNDFRASQDDVIAFANRLLTLGYLIHVQKHPDLNFKTMLAHTITSLIEAAIGVLHNRNGKPYGAAGILQLILKKLPELFFQDDSAITADALRQFVFSDVPGLLTSPSSDFLISIILICDRKPGFEGCVDAVLRSLSENETLYSSPSLRKILIKFDSKKLQEYPKLAQVVSDELDSALSGDIAKWRELQPLLDSEVISPEIKDRILSGLLSGLHLGYDQDAALAGMETVLRTPAFLSGSSKISDRLGQLLLKLEELKDEADYDIAERAAALYSDFKRKLILSDGKTFSLLIAKAVQEQLQLSQDSHHVLSPKLLARLAVDAVTNAASEERSSVARSIIPSPGLWRTAMESLVNYSPLPPDSITSSLQGAVDLIDPVKFTAARHPPAFLLMSHAVRLLSYSTELLNAKTIISMLESRERNAFFMHLPLVGQFVNNKLNANEANQTFDASIPGIDQEMADLVEATNSIVKDWIHSQPSDQPIKDDTFEWFWLSQLDNIRGNTAPVYRLCVSFTDIMSEFVDTMGMNRYLPLWEEKLKLIRPSQNFLQSAGLIVICRDWLSSTQMGKKLCNELVSDTMGLDDDFSSKSWQNLRLLNLLVSGENSLLQSIPQHRLVMLVKHIVNLLPRMASSSGMTAELMRILSNTVLHINDVFGEHWQQMLDDISEAWSSANGDKHDLASLHFSLRLFSKLKTYVDLQTNEDLVDCWNDSLPKMSKALMTVIQSANSYGARDNSLETHKSSKARTITLELTARMTRSLPALDVEDTVDLFPLLAAEERPLQDIGFEVFHRSLPKKQEEVSFDAVISKNVAHLPFELLSLIIDTPTADAIHTDVGGTENADLEHRRYLLSWKVVFDHFEFASHKVRESYAQDLKESGHLEHFLDFAVEILKIAAKPIDASSFDISHFDLQPDIAPAKELVWLAVHLYYQSLRFLPGVAKDWWINSRNRIKTPLEAWTGKYISSSITQSSISGVEEWAKSIDESEERPLKIKTSLRAAEVVAEITIDEENPPASISISLPRSYPFQPASVTSRSRVGVDQKKWQSWLRTIQIIILTSNSIIDGMLAFRRNLLGALKGQNECAICYSIIGQDQKTPDKTCGTCKNTFHSICLFRWFKSSNSSSCPLCRNNFNYA